MTPTEIAKEAAGAIYRFDMEWTIESGPWDEQVSALILTAAAKMVRESGALEALGGTVDYCRLYGLPCPVQLAALAKLRAITEGKA